MKLTYEIINIPAAVHVYDANGATAKQIADHCTDIRADQLPALYVRRDGQITTKIHEPVEQVGAAYV